MAFITLLSESKTAVMKSGEDPWGLSLSALKVGWGAMGLNGFQPKRFCSIYLGDCGLVPIDDLRSACVLWVGRRLGRVVLRPVASKILSGDTPAKRETSQQCGHH